MKLRTQIAIPIVGALLLVGPGLFVAGGNPLLATQRDAGSRSDSHSDSQAPGAPAQIPETIPKGKKLILKDGTFQMAREYSVEGDRVRYWSVERSQWEEIPADLVDWDATHKGEAEQAARDADLKAKIHASNIARLTKDIDVDRSLEIKPNLFLPDEIGFYALDRDKQIRTMKQSNAEVKVSAGREVEKILSGVSLIPGKKIMDIPGDRASMRLKTAEPEFYFRPVDRREPRFRLLRAQIKNGRRVIDNISVNVIGQESHKSNELVIQTWTPATGVFRYTVDQRLEPGEYAFVEMTEDGISGYVWDFGIDLPGQKSK
jgi:hypothetical protein